MGAPGDRVVEVVTMPIDCAACKGAVLLEVDRGRPAPSAQSWTCPYCQELNPGAYEGHVLWVTKDYDCEDTRH